jgi:hypothetical protein
MQRIMQGLSARRCLRAYFLSPLRWQRPRSRARARASNADSTYAHLERHVPIKALTLLRRTISPAMLQHGQTSRSLNHPRQQCLLRSSAARLAA